LAPAPREHVERGGYAGRLIESSGEKALPRTLFSQIAALTRRGKIAAVAQRQNSLEALTE